MYSVLENILNEDEIENINNYILSANTNWVFNRFIAFNQNIHKHVTDNDRNKIMSFRHPILQGNVMYDQTAFDMIKVIPERLGYKNIHNVIGQLNLPVTNATKPIMHVDMPTLGQPYKSCVYYVNDSDGPTVIYKDGKVLIEVEPKKGKLVMFDGDLFHHASIPKTDIRCIINMCFN